MKSWKSVNAGWYGSINRKSLPKIVITDDCLNGKNMQVQYKYCYYCSSMCDFPGYRYIHSQPKIKKLNS